MKQIQTQKMIHAKRHLRRPASDDRQPAPVLTFSAYAWLKLQFLCHVGDTEVGAFGIASRGDLLYVEDVVTVKQRCSSASVEFDDEAVADFFDDQVETGRPPEQFARLWLHTHPGNSPTPSGVDEDTFTRVFGRCDWAVMFILARGGQTYCRLRVGASTASRGLALASPIPVEVDYRTLTVAGFDAPIDDWLKEHEANVIAQEPWSAELSLDSAAAAAPGSDELDADAWVACFEELDPWEQQSILDELGTRIPPETEVAHED